MQYGIVFPGGDPSRIAELSSLAERHGWDGVFVPDAISIQVPGIEPRPEFDPWVTMAAIAVKTERIRFGPMITPLSRRRPWKVAREALTLDHLSNGRFVLPVGLGALDDAGFAAVGERIGRKERAELLDDSLAIITGLWSGRPFSFTGRHYHVAEMTFLPVPVQQPRIPIWVVGLWPNERSMRRVLRWDGLLPNVRDADGAFAPLTPGHVRNMAAYIRERRGDEVAFDIVVEGSTGAAGPFDEVRQFAEAGATWWLESFWDGPIDLDRVERRIAAGPPEVT